MYELRIKLNQDQSTRQRYASTNDVDFHVLLKFHSEGGLTISAHKETVKRKGSALLGKMGIPLAKNFQEALNARVARGVKTYLFLATREGPHEYVIHRCLILGVYDGILDSSQESLVPQYYASRIREIHTWFEISSIHKLTHKEADRIFVLSSGHSISRVINGRPTIFRVGINREQ